MKYRRFILMGITACGSLFLLLFYIQHLFANSVVPRVSYIPVESKAVLNNPYMGFVVDARYDEAEQPFRLAHANLIWSELEPTKGNYAFTEIERKINLALWKEKGVKLVIRVILDYPGDQSHMDIPKWLYEETGRRGTAYNTEYGKGFSPDYTNPVLIRYHRELIKRLAERYNNNPMIAFVEMGSVGHWGEWHTYDGEQLSKHIAFPKRVISNQYVQPYIDYFSDKPLMMRRPHEIALQNGMGLFNDAFGVRESTVDGFLNWYTNGYTNWLTDEEEPAMPDFWTKAPSGGEFAGASDLFSDGSIEEVIQEAKLTHVSWMGPNAPSQEPAGGPLQSNIDRFLTTIGYRFVISEESHEEEVKAGGTLKIKLNVSNRGVAPFYFNWPLELSLTDSAGVVKVTKITQTDIRKWLPGNSEAASELVLPSNLPKGEYTVNAAILDPETGLPGIDFAIDSRRSDGRYALGTVRVTEK